MRRVQKQLPVVPSKFSSRSFYFFFLYCLNMVHISCHWVEKEVQGSHLDQTRLGTITDGTFQLFKHTSRSRWKPLLGLHLAKVWLQTKYDGNWIWARELMEYQKVGKPPPVSTPKSHSKLLGSMSKSVFFQSQDLFAYLFLFFKGPLIAGYHTMPIFVWLTSPVYLACALYTTVKKRVF